MTVGKLATQAGITPDTVRYYERAGLLAPPERTSSGYRTYDQDALERLRFIRGAQRVGLRLREIQELIDVMDRGACPCGHASRLIDERLAEVDDEIEHLRELRLQLKSVAERVAAASPALQDGSWPCQSEFLRMEEVTAHDPGTTDA